MLPALAIAVVAAVVFLVWRSLVGRLVARLLTGVAIGAVVATATAFITDLDSGPAGVATCRAGIVATIANIGGLACGPLVAGLLARYEPHGLTLSFQVFLAASCSRAWRSRSHPRGTRLLTPGPDTGLSISRFRRRRAGS